MAQVAIEELLKRCSSVYRLVVLAAKRAKELADGSVPLVETPRRKITSVALEEILQGKVLYKTDESGDGGKKRRRAKAKEEKKRATA